MESTRRHDLLAVALLVVLTIASLGRIVANDFVSWDDARTIVRNPWLHPPRPASLAAAWRQPRMDLWAPLTYTTWWVIALVAPSDPRAYHAVNLLLHVTAVACVFALLRRLGFSTAPAAIGAAVFAVHPVQVEAVAWASGTKDVLAGMLAIAAIYFYVASTARRRGAYVIATVLAVAAMLAKPTAVVLPALAAIIDHLLLKRPWKPVIRSAGPWVLLALPIAVIAARVQPAPLSAGQQVAPALRPLVASDAIAFYLGRLAWPAKLTVDYGRSPATALSRGWLFWTWLIPLLAAALAVIAARRYRASAPLAALLLLIAALAPVLGLVRTDFQYYSTVADHYVYLPMLAVALLVAWAIGAAKGRLWPALAVVVIVVLSVRSFTQAGVWHDTDALFNHALRINPNSIAALTNLAVDAAEHDRPLDAIRIAQRALELRPDNVQALTTLGSQQARLGRLDVAEQAYRRAVELAPWDALPLSNLAGLLGQTGHTAQALPMAKRAIELDPELASARVNYGTLLANLGHEVEAIQEFYVAVRLNPDDPDAGTNLAILLAGCGQRGAALSEVRRVLALHPNHLRARRLEAELSAAK
jgi:Flp pilus assembly protein TadD